MGASCRLSGLTKNYGARRIVDGISLDVASGEFLVVLGPSGCGKTTTLRMVAGLEQPDAGTISIGDRIVSDPQNGVFIRPERRDLGMVFQSYAIWPHMTVGENVAFPLRARGGAKRAEVRRKVAEALRLVGLENLEDRPSSALSGGQMQRVVLARAVVYDPKILLFDEPLSNLDLKMREHLRTELKALQTRTGLTSIYVTHDQTEAVELADRIAVMDCGRIVQFGPPSEIYRKPATRFVAEFISSANIFKAEVSSVQAPGPDGVPRARLVTAKGRSLVVASNESLRVGDLVDVVIHPEECSLRPAQADGPGEEKARVTQTKFQGVSMRYVLSWADEPFEVVALGTHERFDPGVEVSLVIPPPAAHILRGTTP